ncbi:sensor histidine kinase [Streptomyces sp. NBC_00079]|uniref:sensor histidine kinase n=1 Tax=Streptomyces sp. NBC_00079 TaxID=2975644 RepID=UPI00324827E6
MNLRNRVALVGGTVVLASLVLASLILYPSLSSKLNQQHDGVLVEAALKAPDLLKAFKEQNTGEPVARTSDGRFVSDFPVRPFDVGNTLLQFVQPVTEGPMEGFIKVSKKDVDVAAGRTLPYFQEAEYDGVRYRVYTAQLTGFDGALVRTAVPLSVIGTTLDRLEVLLIGITLGGVLLAWLAARLASGRVLRPVRQLTEMVEHVTQTQDLTAPIEARGRDEIARLARSFAVMMAALDSSLQAQRRLVADASHELRTPLTSLTTNLELLDDGPGVRDPKAPELVRNARLQAHGLKVLVNDLIDLARYGRPDDLGTHTEDTRLDLLAERVVAAAKRRAPHLEIRTELAECLVHADPDAVERAVGNLVDNAVKWSPQGGAVVVVVDADGNLTVTDDGPGIPTADLPYIFDRFYRSPTARSLPGSGLGLAIVRQIAEAHDGRVVAEPLEPGLRMRLWLPPTST